MINANKDYLISFFSGNVQYIVPFFQRPYVWEYENWEILWESLKEVYDDYKNDITSEHFIGTLIIKQKQAEKIGENCFELIDGQQRLTTFALLLKAIADTCNGDLPKLKERLFELLVFEDSRAQKHIRIIHNKIDKPYYEKIMLQDDWEILNAKANNNRLTRAYQYFLEKVNVLSDEERDMLKDIILNKVPIISMIISSNDDEQEIFDTINSLGVKLTTAELLKNFIFKEAELQQLYENVWQSSFETNEEVVAFWNKDKTSGRIIRTNIEVLLYCYLIIQTKKEIKLEKLYKEYKNWLADKDIDEKKSFLFSLKNYAEIYFSIPEGEELNELSFQDFDKRFFHFIESLSITTIYPLIIYLYKEISQPEVLKTYLSFLESYLVRRYVCKLTTKAYNNLFISILQKLILIKDELGFLSLEKFQDLFQSFNDETNIFPSDETFRDAFSKSFLSNQISKEILFTIALFQQNDGLSDIKKLSSSSFSVEHILPKQWEQYWLTGPMDELEKNERNKKLLTLGNLTLITKKLNSKLKNESWLTKKETLKKYSGLRITTNYLELNNWDETIIDGRAQDLFNLALSIWPNPNYSINVETKIIDTKVNDLSNHTKVKNKINQPNSKILSRNFTKSKSLDYSEVPKYFEFSNTLESADKFELVATMRVKDVSPKPDCNEKKGDLLKRLRHSGIEKALDLKGIKNAEELRDYLDNHRK